MFRRIRLADFCVRRAAFLLFCLLSAVFFFACNESAKRPIYYDRLDIPDRIESQQKWIDDSATAGQITPADADVLQDNLNWIRAEFSRVKADGRVSMAERDEVDSLLERNSRMIRDRKQEPKRLRP